MSKIIGLPEVDVDVPQWSTTNAIETKDDTPTPFVPMKPEDFKGLYICKEFSGVRYLGTVQFYDRRKKLLKVKYDDYRTEYLNLNDIKKYKATKEDIEEARREYKLSENFQTLAPKKRKTPTSVETSFAGKGKKISEATPAPFVPVKPEDFRGFYICREYNGAKYLGTVQLYDKKKKLFKVEYDDYRTEYLNLDDVKNYKATKKDIDEARQEYQKGEQSQNPAP